MPRPQGMLPYGFYDVDPRSTRDDEFTIQIAYRPTDNTAQPLLGATPGLGGFWEIWRSYDPKDLEQEFDAPWSPDLTASGKEIYLHRLQEDLERLPIGLYTVRVFSPTRKKDGETGWISTPLRQTGTETKEIVERVGELLDAAPQTEGTDEYRRNDRPKRAGSFFVFRSTDGLPGGFDVESEE